MKTIELLPMKSIGKNLIYGNNNVEVVVVAEGTQSIENWAFEKCPNLKTAYVPKNVQVADNAFFDVHPDFQIIRTE
jgi:hypothetical protein